MIAIKVSDCERNCGGSGKVPRAAESAIAPAQKNAHLGSSPVSHGQVEITVLVEVGRYN
jgi:hypothetical protein